MLRGPPHNALLRLCKELLRWVHAGAAQASLSRKHQPVAALQQHMADQTGDHDHMTRFKN
jgi:hypothetical protein